MKKILLTLLLLIAFFPKSTVWATEANLKCSPASGTFNVGDTFSVEYVLDTRTFGVFGADVVATYDPNILDVPSPPSISLTTATNWGQPAKNTIDTTLGKIELDYGSAQPTYTGSSSIGKVTFKAKATGQAQFNFTFLQPKDNTTPGVAKVWGKLDGTNLSNILSDVNNCIYVINASVATPTGAPPPTFGPTCAAGTPEASGTPCPSATKAPVPTVSQLPRSGSAVETLALLVLAGLFFIGAAVPMVFVRR